MPAPIVTLETTAGDLVVELAPDAAPKTVENFLAYVRAGWYGGTVFHRVIRGFVAQAGGYLADGRKKDPLLPPFHMERSPLKHVDGALGMARLPSPATSTSEFYFCDGPQRDLDGNYTVFGRLLEGRDALRRILGGPTKPGDWPLDPPAILRAYEGMPDPQNPAPRFQPPAPKAAQGNAPADVAEVEAVRAAARKLRGRAAMLRARRPLMAMAEVEAAIAQADRTGKRDDLTRAETMLAEKEKK